MGSVRNDIFCNFLLVKLSYMVEFRDRVGGYIGYLVRGIGIEKGELEYILVYLCFCRKLFLW